MHPLAAPGTLWVLSSDGKYLVRPQADETSHKEQISCARQGKGPILLFPYHKEFRLCGGDQRAFRSPFGNLRAPLLRTGLATRNRFLAQGKEPSIFFPHHRRFRLCGGDQGAFRSPPGPLRGPVFLAGGRNLPQTAVSLWQAREMPFLLFPACTKPSLKYNKKEPGAIDRTGLRLSKKVASCGLF